VARDFNKLRLPPVDLKKLALDPKLKDLGRKLDLPAVPEGLKELGDVDWRPAPRPATESEPTPPPLVDEPTPAPVAQPEPQCEREPPLPQPEPAPPDRSRARKQAAIQDIACRVFPPDGKVPPNIKTAKFKRDHVDPTWDVVAPTHDLAGSPSPDWHTVHRALGREL
jgi:hypothetical protein